MGKKSTLGMCSVLACGRPVVCKKLCDRHYRLHLEGKPLKPLLVSERHGHAGNGSQTREYTAWNRMIGRCCNPNNPDYRDWGGRGIQICEKWRKSFVCFLKDMGPHPGKGFSLGRIDNEKGYYLDNCRWETQAVQNNNRRVSRMLTFKGETLCLKEWAHRYNLSGQALAHRMDNLGLSLEEAFTRPKGRWANRGQQMKDDWGNR